MNNDYIILGERQDWGEPQLFGISAVDQRQHIYMIGKTGSGKTTLLKNMIVQHIEKGHRAERIAHGHHKKIVQTSPAHYQPLT